MTGKRHTEATKLRISQIKKDNPQRYWLGKGGEEHPMWMGGTSNLPYSFDFNKQLKTQIKERDGNCCAICRGTGVLHIHHIDYNKQNSSTANLITLCASCHSKTNVNREHWKNYFRNVEVLHW